MNQQIYEEASEWLVEFRTEEPDRASRVRFEKWLAKSPEHVQAYLEVSGIWETLSAQAPLDPRDLDDLIERARATPNIVSLGTGHEQSHTASVRQRQSSASLLTRLSRSRALIATAATLLVAVFVTITAVYTQRNVYTTAIGEQRSILLPDGSTINLNARSRIRVNLDAHTRHIELLEGQALFRVAKDKTRPFIVAANGTHVRAVGTQFDVNQRKRRLIVTVIEGTVAVSGAGARESPGSTRVSPASAPEAAESSARPRGSLSGISAKDGEILLNAGEQTIVQPNALPMAHGADVVTATAWTQRRLIFDSTPLEDVATEFNRNSERTLIIQGHDLDGFHISGAFSSTDVEAFLRFLRVQEGIQVIEEPDRIIITSK